MGKRVTPQEFNAKEEAFCAVIDYCHCGNCVIASHCQLTMEYMCPKGKAYYDGFVKAVEIMQQFEKKQQ